MTHTFAAISAFALAAILLLALTLQYPFSTTLPIGGDATRYIASAEAVIDASTTSFSSALTILLHNSVYPGTIALLAIIHRLLSVSWPSLFTALMTVAHILTGLTISWWIYRTSGWLSATFSLAIWALTTTEITPSFEDGTLAQLMSLPVLLLALECAANGRLKTSLGLLIATFLLHPLSGVVAASTLVVYILINSTQKKLAKAVAVGTIVLITAILLIKYRWIVLSSFQETPIHHPLANLIQSRFGPYPVLALGSLLLLTAQLKQRTHLLVILIFTGISTLFFLNDFLGIGLLTHRFQTYFIIAVTMISSLGIPSLLRLGIPPRWLRAIFIFLLLSTTSVLAWSQSAQIYRHYESPSRYARLHPDEQAAIAWMDQHLPPGSFIVSTRVNRHSEWIPILSQHRWVGLAENDEFFLTDPDAHIKLSQAKGYTHAVFFLNREKPPLTFAENQDRYPIIYQNKGAVVVALNTI